MRAKIKDLISRIQSITKTDVPYLIRGNFWLGIGSIVATATSLLLALAFGNLASPENYGTYRFVLSFYSILAVSGLGGFGAATVRAVARGFEGEFLKSFKIQVWGSLIGSAVAFVIATYYFLNENATLGLSFAILGIVLPFIESLALYEALLNGRKEFKKSTIFSIISQVGATILILGAIFLKFETPGLLITFFSSWIGLRLIFFLYTIKKYKPNSQLGDQTTKLGAHLTLMGILNTVATYLDRIVLFHTLGAAQVAIYSFAIAPSEQIKSLFKNVNILAMPRFSERSERELKNTMLKKMTLMGLAVCLLIIAYIIAAPFLFKLFLPKYTSSVFPSQIFTISLIAVIANLPVSAMKALSKIRGLYVYNTILPIVNIALILILTPMYGLMGTIMARSIGRIFGIFLSLFSLYKIKN